MRRDRRGPCASAAWRRQLGRQVHAQSASSAAAGDERVAVDDAFDAEALAVGERLDRRERADAFAGGGGYRLGDRMLGGVLQRADQPECVDLVDAVGDRHPRERHLARGHRAGLVEDDRVDLRVDSRTSGPLMSRPSWAPRPVPTMSAVGVASPRAHGQAMMSTATIAVNAKSAGSPEPSQNPRVPAAMMRTTGTKMPEMRSARRWTGALPVCASDTSGDLRQRGVGADLRGADHQAPADVDGRADHIVARRLLDRHRLAGQQRLVDGRGALLDDAVGGDLLPRADDEAVALDELVDGDAPLGAVGVQDGDVLGAEREQGLERRAGAALGARLEEPAEQQERDDDRADLEEDVMDGLAALGDEIEAHPHLGVAGLAEEHHDDRPRPRRERPDRHERVHRRGAVLEVLPRRLVKRPRSPQDHRGGELKRDPLPEVELERRDHRDDHHGDRERECPDDALAQVGELGRLGVPGPSCRSRPGPRRPLKRAATPCSRRTRPP
jgi:hypothetical protein